MPNWVANVINFEGKQEDIDRVFAEISDIGNKYRDQTIFDFNKLIPIPKTLKIESGSHSDLAYAYYTALKFNKLPKNSYMKSVKEVIDRVEKDINISSQEMLELGRTIAENVDKYKAKDWYDWRRAKWGTKWNACSCDRAGNKLTFQTAWSWAEPVMRKLAGLCGEYGVTFDGKWADEDCGNNAGGFDSDLNGELYYEHYDFRSSEAYEAYEECHGKSGCIAVDENGRYYHYDCGESCPNYAGCCC